MFQNNQEFTVASCASVHFTCKIGGRMLVLSQLAEAIDFCVPGELELGSKSSIGQLGWCGVLFAVCKWRRNRKRANMEHIKSVHIQTDSYLQSRCSQFRSLWKGNFKVFSHVGWEYVSATFQRLLLNYTNSIRRSSAVVLSGCINAGFQRCFLHLINLLLTFNIHVTLLCHLSHLFIMD